ncbi:MAG: glutaminase A [Herbiconiux sp.]|uniref:glutaminase A n=1 Tax=Herbiconiux sp. TaxID=1871186 RepID=UPI001229CCF4|nr:glutaminase A [Herbiconiux sp.]TAJ46844.1 MAG: glutaminase A [Herbiconiux sp.]
MNGGEAAGTGAVIDPLCHPVTDALGDLLATVRRIDPAGELADYIPELARVDANGFGIAATATSGHSYAAGDADRLFTIQSVSKPFVYALALEALGREAVLERVGVEPSGEPFNAISFDQIGRPANPMINAGAIVATSLIPAADAEERFAVIRAGLSAFAGRPLDLAHDVYESESATGDRNRGLAHLARASGMLGSTVADAVEPYFQQCSLLVDTGDLAMMAATLANGGEHPLTGERVVAEAVARDVLSVMASCGMYDRSGDWMFRVGMPAKSGVGGGIVAVTPGQYGIGVYSPPLDSAGNSSRGVAALQLLSAEFGLHMLDRPRESVSAVESIRTDAATGAITVEVRGEIDFVAAEQIVYAAMEAVGGDGSGTHTGTETAALVIDLGSATRATPVAARLMRAMAGDAGTRGYRISVRDPAGILVP